MAISIQLSGKLGEILKTFKADFLSKLDSDDLEKTVVLTVKEPSEEEDIEDLKEKIIEAIENE